MKTYYCCCLLFAILFIGCSKTDNPAAEEIDDLGFDVHYSFLLERDEMLETVAVNANLDTITILPDESLFEGIPLPEELYRDGYQISVYHKNLNCSGSISRYDFNSSLSASTAVFADIDNCELLVSGIAHSQNAFFIAYEIPSESKDNAYYVRLVDILNTDDSSNFIDIPLPIKPIQLISSDNSLFILAHDIFVTEKYTMFVLDHGTKILEQELDLGEDVQKMVKNNSGDILISYPTLHTVISSSTLETVSQVRYLEGKEPKFGNASSTVFEGNKIYYPMQTEFSPIYTHVPAVYDFGTKTATLYLYENLFSAEKLTLEYEIDDTTMVSYDAKNNLLLIGYRKKNQSNLGGLLRIKPAPDPKFIDNTNLNGIPRAVFLN